MKDLIVLVADKDMKEAMLGILSRYQSLSIRPISYEIIVHTGRDPGCWKDAENELRIFLREYTYALVLFDHEGSGQEGQPVAKLQEQLEERLARNGWDDKARVIVIEPELEIWVWSQSSRVDEHLGWSGRDPSLREWLVENEYLGKGQPKPTQPKEALIDALKIAKEPLSHRLYRYLAESVSLQYCQDPSFIRLKETLQTWFPA